MKIQVGAGYRPIDGFVNCDICPSPGLDYIARAEELFFCAGNAAQVVFSNAVFEHIDPLKYSILFNEWKRVINQDGYVIALGIPDFDTIVKLYLRGDMDLDSVYRYSLGELSDQPDLISYVGQIHKKFFTLENLFAIFSEAKFNTVAFRYSYPGETRAVNLGIVATVGEKVPAVPEAFALVPSIENFINLEDIIQCLE